MNELNAYIKELVNDLNPIHANLKSAGSFIPCPRCTGSGYFNCFSHINNGRCFKCGGTKTVPANNAAKNSRALVSKFNAIRYDATLCKTVEQLKARMAHKELINFIENLPKKYK